MSEIHIVRDYPHPPAKVWRAVTDPALVPLWTATGAGGRPEGFAPAVGTKFRLIAKPKPGWNGIVDCEVLEVDEPSLLRYSWVGGDGGGDVTEVAYRLEPRPGGTRFSYEHTGFTGIGGVFMAALLGHVRRKMLTVGLPAVLNDLDEVGTLRPGSTLKPKSQS
ncbi:MAG: SRPBCC domain-containing protein [Streptosporangiaceae bacterium]